MKRLNFFDKLLHLLQAAGKMQKRTGYVAEWVSRKLGFTYVHPKVTLVTKLLWSHWKGTLCSYNILLKCSNFILKSSFLKSVMKNASSLKSQYTSLSVNMYFKLTCGQKTEKQGMAFEKLSGHKRSLLYPLKGLWFYMISKELKKKVRKDIKKMKVLT